MIKKIITDEKLLKLKSEYLDSTDHVVLNKIIDDLLDTAEHYRDSKMGCAGLAANQIGYLVRVFVFKLNHWYEPVINPRVINKGGRVITGMESCLSRPDQPPIKKGRFQRITIEYTTQDHQLAKGTFHHFNARVIQHELDHFDGILI